MERVNEATDMSPEALLELAATMAKETPVSAHGVLCEDERVYRAMWQWRYVAAGNGVGVVRVVAEAEIDQIAQSNDGVMFFRPERYTVSHMIDSQQVQVSLERTHEDDALYYGFGDEFELRPIPQLGRALRRAAQRANTVAA